MQTDQLVQCGLIAGCNSCQEGSCLLCTQCIDDESAKCCPRFHHSPDAPTRELVSTLTFWQRILGCVPRWRVGRVLLAISEVCAQHQEWAVCRCLVVQSFLTIARECVSQVETTPLGGLGLVNIENDAVQKRTLIRSRWGTTQTGCCRLIGEATPATVHPALHLSKDAVQRELA